MKDVNELVKRLKETSLYAWSEKDIEPLLKLLDRQRTEAAAALEAQAAEIDMQQKSYLNFLADLREKTGVGAKPMITELPGAIAEVIEAKDAEIARLREALEPVTTFADKMSDNALRLGLEGTSDWDQIAGSVDIFGIQENARAALQAKP